MDINVHDRLKQIRKDNKLTQTEFANMFEMSQSTLSNYEKGLQEISLDMVWKICGEFNISPVWLAFGIQKDSLESQLPKDSKDRLIEALEGRIKNQED